MVTMDSYAKNNPAVVTKVVTAMILAARWIMNNRAQASTVITDYLKLGSSLSNYVLPDWSMNGLALTKSYNWWGNLLYAYGTITSPINATSFYDPTYVNQALKNVGTVQDTSFTAVENLPLPSP